MSITGDAFFIGLILLGAFFTMFSMKRPNLLLAIVTSATWFVMAMWLFFSVTPPIGLDESWKEVFSWVFFLMALVPWLFQMDVEIHREAKGYGSWTKWGEEPEDKGPTAYESYRERLYGRTRKGG